MSEYGKAQIERHVLLSIVGICTALEQERLTIDEANHLLFSPAAFDVLREQHLGEELVDLIHIGTELEDIESLQPHRLVEVIASLKNAALDRLAKLPPYDFQERKWLLRQIKSTELSDP